jgi:glycosyltransferase involved in cell wall biosynthesis
MARRILFVHNNFPGQFGALSEELARRGDVTRAIGSRTARDWGATKVERWALDRNSTPGLLPLATRIEADMIRGRVAAHAALRLRAEGFAPDLIIGHPGWGETMFLKEVFPDAKQILHAEFFYRSTGADTGFDPDFERPHADAGFRTHAKNAGMALSYAEAERLVAPTPFQAGLLPSMLRDRCSIIHEGVDTDAIRPRENPFLTFKSGRKIDRSTPVITLINRTLEPLRGFNVFMRALPAVMKAVPAAQVIIIGKDGPASYGPNAPKGSTWKSVMLEELKGQLDLGRVHFTGHLPHKLMLDVLAVSAAHVYYTYPFVLSWSLIEAMASGCNIIASDTAPVRDALEDGVSATLLDFFNVAALSEALISACENPERYAPLREAARKVAVERYDKSTVCMPAWLNLIDEVSA